MQNLAHPLSSIFFTEKLKADKTYDENKTSSQKKQKLVQFRAGHVTRSIRDVIEFVISIIYYTV